MAVVAAVATVVTAATAVTEGVMNYQASQAAAAAQKSLANEQASQLAAENAARDALAHKEAETGSVFGRDTTDKIATGLGFGASGQSTGFGRSDLSGGGQ